MSSRPTIVYQPALDGVRAFAVVAVLLFHAGVPGFDGGYLGVSVFFTLSGFLITSLLLREHGDSGTIDLAAFYARRLRRLLPASVVCLVGVAMIATTTDLFDGVANLRAHLLGAVFQVANWVFVAGDGSYQDLLERTSGTSSPLEHFWSLAIEEQFYWLWPPLMLFVLSRVPRRRGRVVVVGGLAVLTSVSAPVIALVWGPDAAYWSTPARMSEILIGAALATVLAGRSVPGPASPVHAPAGEPRPIGTGQLSGMKRSAATYPLSALGPIALAVLLVCIVTFPSAGGPAYAGALPLVAVASAGLVLGLQQQGPLRRLLEHGGIVWVGKVSYGLYLFHWPIFVLVHPDRLDWPGPLLFVVRMMLTLAVTIVSYELIEQPIRTHRASGPRLTFTTAAVSTAAVLWLAVAVVPSGVGEYWIVDSRTAEAASIDVTDEPLVGLTATPATTPATIPATIPDTTPSRPATTPTSTPTPTPTPTSASASTSTAPTPTNSITTAPAPSTTAAGRTPTTTSTAPPAADLAALPQLSRPVRILVTGDSTAKAFGTGLVNWAALHPELAQVEVVGAPGCGIVTGGERRTGDSIEPVEGCDGWIERFVYPEVERLRPDVVVAMVTSWDLIDRRWDGGALLTPFDAEYAGRLEADYRAFTTGLETAGAGSVALIRHPIPDPFWLPSADAQEDPARHRVIYELYDRLAAERDRVEVVALDEWLRDVGLELSEELRPDGIHPTPEASTEVSERYLGEQLVRIALGAHTP